MGKSKRAIVARMDEAGRSLVVRYLERNGYTVIATGNGAEALTALRENPPDLLFADGVLPKCSGFDLCREAKRSGGHPVAVVIVVEENDSYGRGRARADGCDLMLNEPVLEDDLDDVLAVKAGDGSAVENVLSNPSGRDRFLKELLRVPSKSDPIVSRITDPLTGLNHRGYMALKLDEEFKKAKRYNNPLALIFVDIDNHADVTERHGRPVAQEMLLELAGVFLCESRDVDAAGRVEESRFMLLLPNTDLAGARIMANRVFENVCGRRVASPKGEIAIRVSVGIAALPGSDVDTVDAFAEQALRAMKTAAKMGGNRICAFGDVTSPA
jgi:two-component system, cell cycle response regulator